MFVYNDDVIIQNVDKIDYFYVQTLKTFTYFIDCIVIAVSTF